VLIFLVAVPVWAGTKSYACTLRTGAMWESSSSVMKGSGASPWHGCWS